MANWLIADSKLPPNPEFASLRDGTHWVAGEHLGKGSGGIATLWNAVSNRTGKVTQRIVIKSMAVRPASHLMNRGQGSNQLREGWIMNALQPVDDTADSPIARLHACESQVEDNSRWRLYMDYYSHGNLSDLVEANVGVVFKDDGTFILSWQVPEPFVWFFFRRLALAAVEMDTRLRTKERPYVVAHLDLKSDNILFAGPGSHGKDKDFPMYPPGYVADFGISRVTYEGDPEIQKYTLNGTRGWWAPESFAPNFGEKAAMDVPIHSWTNIWQIGRIIYCLMEGDVTRSQIDFFSNKDKVPQVKGWRFSSDDWKDYSKDLNALMRQCMAYKPEKRPTPQVLLNRIDELMPSHEDVMRRWGTAEWFDAADQATGAEEEGDSYMSQGNGNAAAVVTNPEAARESSGSKRKRTSELGNNNESDAKRAKVKAAKEIVTKRRQRLVVQQMKEGRKMEGPPDHVSPSDDNFVLGKELKLRLPRADPLFDVNAYFSGRAPAATRSDGPIIYPSKEKGGEEATEIIDNDNDPDDDSDGDDHGYDDNKAKNLAKLLKAFKKAGKNTKSGVKSAVTKAKSIVTGSPKLGPKVQKNNSSMHLTKMSK